MCSRRYLPAYEASFRAGASGAMCSYNSINGRPNCANGPLLTALVKGKWSPTAIVTSDCNAVADLRGAPAHAPSAEHAAAWALNNGTDVEMGSSLYRQVRAPLPHLLWVSPTFSNLLWPSLTFSDRL